MNLDRKCVDVKKKKERVMDAKMGDKTYMTYTHLHAAN